jgi:photosystem II stability/assembly factor-like uncharacterized protein
MPSSSQPQSASELRATTERWSRSRSGGSGSDGGTTDLVGSSSVGVGAAAASIGSGGAAVGSGGAAVGGAVAVGSEPVSCSAAPGLGLAHAVTSPEPGGQRAEPPRRTTYHRWLDAWPVFCTARSRLAGHSFYDPPMTARFSPWLFVTVLLLPACKEDDGGDDGPSDPSGPSDPNDPMDPPPDSWMVGEEGEMLRVSALGDASTYPLEHAGDFAAITCHGTATAWVVGEAGTVLLSRDAGETWAPVALAVPERSHLRAVAAAEGQREGAETLVIAGDDGVVVRSTDGGGSFAPIEGPAVDWTAVATDELGVVAFVTGEDGSLWRSDGGAPLVRVLAGEGEALHDVAMSHDGAAIVAVGEGGLVLWSHDAGERFETLPSATSLDLHAVHVAADHETIVAVGEAGVVVHIDAEGSRVHETLRPDDALLDLHLRADGVGQAVGTHGTVLFTRDAGRSWEPVDTGRTADLHGVDDFHRAPHL